jgi:hypothetical protein
LVGDERPAPRGRREDGDHSGLGIGQQLGEQVTGAVIGDQQASVQVAG